MDTITISRDVFDNPIFRSPERLRIWLALLFAADENGEVVIRLRPFAANVGVSLQQLRGAINAFLVDNVITQTTTQQATQQATQEISRNRTLRFIRSANLCRPRICRGLELVARLPQGNQTPLQIGKVGTHRLRTIGQKI